VHQSLGSAYSAAWKWFGVTDKTIHEGVLPPVRVDFALQDRGGLLSQGTSVFTGAQEYWSNRDLMVFMLGVLTGEPATRQAASAALIPVPRSD
jgi:hypothetical protein